MTLNVLCVAALAMYLLLVSRRKPSSVAALSDGAHWLLWLSIAVTAASRWVAPLTLGAIQLGCLLGAVAMIWRARFVR